MIYKEILEGTPEWYKPADARAYLYVYFNGSRSYWYKNRAHRADGPAYISVDGKEEYFIDGFLHRVDGPARVDRNGKKTYYLNGHRLSYRDWLKKTKTLLEEEKSQEIKDLVI